MTAKIYKATIDQMGRIEVRDKTSGNLLFTLRPAEVIVETLTQLDYSLDLIEIEWHPEPYKPSE